MICNILLFQQKMYNKLLHSHFFTFTKREEVFYGFPRFYVFLFFLFIWYQDKQKKMAPLSIQPRCLRQRIIPQLIWNELWKPKQCLSDFTARGRLASWCLRLLPRCPGWSTPGWANTSAATPWSPWLCCCLPPSPCCPSASSSHSLWWPWPCRPCFLLQLRVGPKSKRLID